MAPEGAPAPAPAAIQLSRTDGSVLAVRLLGTYASTRYTLDPDPTGTYAATGAEDRYLGMRAVLRGEF